LKEKLFVADGAGKLNQWDFEVPNVFQNNRVYLEVPSDKTIHRAYLDVYRGGAGEASFRLTGVGTASAQFSIFSEAHVLWWVNDFFGSPDFYFSRQRWGFSAKYFTSLSQLKEVEEGSGTLTVMQVDTRYRLTPGLWEKDESVGLIGSFESVKVGQFNVSKFGAGVFWARSMPRVFDRWFSLLPYMNYPKWVDMEFIKYLTCTDGKYALGDDYVINFHGKVLWTKRFFGEAGFGIKNYFAESEADRTHFKLTTFYGTVGLGINF
jgi:hypothetical protein